MRRTDLETHQATRGVFICQVSSAILFGHFDDQKASYSLGGERNPHILYRQPRLLEVER